MKTVMIALIATATLSQAAHAESAVPTELIIGYDSEGKVDPAPQACLAHVKEVTEWDKAATERGAQQVCAARKRHADAYAALQSNYKAFVEAFSKDRRLNLPEAVSNLKTLIKACMDHKFGITTGGHNIMIDVIENDVSAGCLTLGSNLIKDETRVRSPRGLANDFNNLSHFPDFCRMTYGKSTAYPLAFGEHHHLCAPDLVVLTIWQTTNRIVMFAARHRDTAEKSSRWPAPAPHPEFSEATRRWPAWVTAYLQPNAPRGPSAYPLDPHLGGRLPTFDHEPELFGGPLGMESPPPA